MSAPAAATGRTPPVLSLCGPTATKKTAFAVQLARALDGEVVSCDSMQIYSGMSIGTAAPSEAERCEIRHHMIGFLHPSTRYSVADYCKDALGCIEQVYERGHVPIVVGGTGLYMDSLLNGIQFEELPSSDELRAELHRMAHEVGGEKLLDMLSETDAGTAQRLHPKDIKRIVRALEVQILTGKTLTQLSAEQARLPTIRAVRFGLDYENRALLYKRIDARVDSMLERGLLEEVRELLRTPGIEKSTALQAIGYKELARVVLGEEQLDVAVTAIKRATRRYAKRQRTWFSRNPEVSWFLLDRQSEEDILLSMLRLYRAHTD